MRLVRATFFVLLAGWLAGCTGEVRSRLGERAVVKGRVTVHGSPVTRGTVVFTPVDPTRGDEQIGAVRANGAYITSVFLGTYKVSLADANVPAKYRSSQGTDLQIDVPAGGKDGADFDLK
jgi:hypothetical protein